MLTNHEIGNAMNIKLDNQLPAYPAFQEGIRRAPDRGFRLTPEQTKIALKNALRYVPEELHETLVNRNDMYNRCPCNRNGSIILFW